MTIRMTRPAAGYRFREIAGRIEDRIAQGLILPGDRLPAERELAAALRVSRSSVREAFRLLEQKGLVEIRRGTKGGAYVIPPTDRHLVEGMDLLLRSDRLSLDQIAEFRESIESSATVLAAERAKPEDIRMLKHQLEAARSYIGQGGGWVDAFIQADKAVHLSIAQISRNPLSTKVLESTLGLQPYFCRFLRLHPRLMEDNYKDLACIVQAIEKRQPDAAGRLCREHITRFNQAVP